MPLLQGCLGAGLCRARVYVTAACKNAGYFSILILFGNYLTEVCRPYFSGRANAFLQVDHRHYLVTQWN